MRDGEHRDALGDIANVVADLPLGDGVQGAGHLIKDQQLRTVDERSGNGDPLPLAAGEAGALFADFGEKAFRKAGDEVGRAGDAQRLDDLVLADAGIAESDVGEDAVVQQDQLLRYVTDTAPPRADVDLRQRYAVDKDFAPVRVGRIPAADRSSSSCPFPRGR